MNSRYDKVVGKLLQGETVKNKDLMAAWRDCPTEYPHPVFREYTVKWLTEKKASAARERALTQLLVKKYKK